jgi:hypothetical protein
MQTWRKQPDGLHRQFILWWRTFGLFVAIQDPPMVRGRSKMGREGSHVSDKSPLDRYLRSYFYYPSGRYLEEVGCIASGFRKGDE